MADAPSWMQFIQLGLQSIVGAAIAIFSVLLTSQVTERRARKERLLERLESLGTLVIDNIRKLDELDALIRSGKILENDYDEMSMMKPYMGLFEKTTMLASLYFLNSSTIAISLQQTSCTFMG